MEDSFAWTGIAHSGRQYTQNGTISRIVVSKQHLIAAHTYISGNIITLGITNQWMQVETINRLHRAFLNILMCAVYRVPRLETNHTLPTPLCEQLTRLGWCKAIA